MVKSQSIAPNKKELQLQAQNSWREVKTNDKNNIQTLITELLKTPIQPSPFTFFSQQKPVIVPPAPPDILFKLPDKAQHPPNAAAQRQSDAILQKAKDELYEYTNLSQVATSPALCTQFTSKIKTLKGTITLEENRLKWLKGNAAA